MDALDEVADVYPTVKLKPMGDKTDRRLIGALALRLITVRLS